MEETTPPPDGMLRATAGRVTRVVHCSDLHYGHGFLELRAEHLAERIKELKPDAVVVSGDLTMRARAGQFAKARKFLLELQTPLLVIPGNHDIPVYDVFTRMVMPFRNYNKYAGDLSTNPLVLPHVAFMGLNTVYVWKHQEGRVRPKELEQAVEWLKSLPGATWKVIVVHQHFINLEGHERPGVMYRGAEVLRTLSEAGADAILHGHTHYNPRVPPSPPCNGPCPGCLPFRAGIGNPPLLFSASEFTRRIDVPGGAGGRDRHTRWYAGHRR